MENLKCELIRIKTQDNLELQGLLFEPKEKTTQILIHVPGWTGNFYENLFIDYFAKELLENKIAFLTFNTRGAGHVQDFIKKINSKQEYVMIGGSLEKFEDSIYDIKAAVEFLNKKGYTNIILDGHSTACQKIVFYNNQTKDSRIKGLIFLEPTDDPSVAKKFLGDRYDEAIETAKNMIIEKKGKDPMPNWVPFGKLLSAQKFISMSDPTSTEGKLFNYLGDLKEIRKIKCPVLAVSGANTEYQEKPGEKLEILKNKINDCETKLFPSNHWFVNYEKELAKLISNWIIKKIG